MSELFMRIQNDEFQDYLRDESRSVGVATSISFPRTATEVKQIVALVAQQGIPLTVQGARTGLAAGAVPQGGHIMNLSKLDRIRGLRHDPSGNTFYLQVEPGVLLTDLRHALANLEFAIGHWAEDSRQALARLQQQGSHFFTPDPTETSATIGGMIACNASGALSYYYGPTRNYVEALQIVLMNGATLNLRRGQQRVTGGRFQVTTDTGEVISSVLPEYTLPAVKNASGYYLQPDMDLIDLFIGSEGTLGIIVAAELRLLPTPPAIWGITAFLPSEEIALRLVRALRGEPVLDTPLPHLPRPVAIEFFNCRALELLRQQRQHNPAFQGLQELQDDYHTAIYLEWHGDSEEQLYQVTLQLGHLLEACGGDEAATWVAVTADDLEQLKFFRHATPECVNLLLDQRRQTEPHLTKLGTDMAVPDSQLLPIMELYNSRLAAKNLESVIFGHIGDNHLHVNILPRNLSEYEQGRQLYLEWAEQAVAMGGTVSAEHGIGKLKTAFLATMYGSEGIDRLRAVKALFDPQGLLNPGNVFTLADGNRGRC